MKIIVLYRQTEDWLNYVIPNKLLHSLKKEDLLEWERFYNIKFGDYRFFLKEIASVLLSLYSINEVKNYPIDFDDDDLIIPTDDDDWLHPNILPYLSDNTCDIFYWNTMVFQSVTTFNFHSWYPSHQMCSSNGFAIRGSALKKLKLHSQKNIILNHCSVFTDGILNNFKTKFLHDYLSVYLWNFSSSSVIRNYKPLKVFPQNIIPLLPNCVSWAKVPFERYVQKHQEIKDKLDLKLL